MPCAGRFLLQPLTESLAPTGVAYLFNSTFVMEQRQSSIRVQPVPIPRAHGSSVPPRVWRNSSTITLVGWIYTEAGDTAEDFFTSLRSLHKIVKNRWCKLRFPRDHFAYVIPQAINVGEERAGSDIRQVSVTFAVPDPMSYLQSGAEWIYASGSGAVSVTLGGDENSEHWDLWFSDAAHEYVKLVSSLGSLTLRRPATGLSIKVDCYRKKIYTGGTTTASLVEDWRPYVSGEFFALPPGSPSIGFYDGQAGTIIASGTDVIGGAVRGAYGFVESIIGDDEGLAIFGDATFNQSEFA